MTFVTSEQARVEIKEKLERQGYLPAEADAMSKALSGRSWIGTNDVLVYPYMKLLSPREEVPSLGIFPWGNPCLETIPLAPRLSGGYPKRYTVHHDRANGLFYLLRTVMRDAGGGSIQVGNSKERYGEWRPPGQDRGCGHTVLPGGALRLAIAIWIPCSFGGPPPAYPTGTLSQQAFRLNAWELAEWLERKGCPHPVVLKEALRKAVTVPDAAFADKTVEFHA
jgi:hypothetical protein